MKFEYPLQWLPQQPRTKSPKRSQFQITSVSRAGDELVEELKRLGAKEVIISSNLQTRLRGDGFYANQRVDDAGVVAYFKLKGSSKAMACDKWDRVEHNVWSLKKSIESIRGLERWGGSEFLDGLFTGFQALPSPDDVINTAPQFFADCTDEKQMKERYKRLVKELHPDTGGTQAEFQEMQRQYKNKEGLFDED